VVDELGVRKFVKLPELPAASIVNVATTTASSYHSNKNVNEPRK